MKVRALFAAGLATLLLPLAAAPANAAPPVSSSATFDCFGIPFTLDFRLKAQHDGSVKGSVRVTNPANGASVSLPLGYTYWTQQEGRYWSGKAFLSTQRTIYADPYQELYYYAGNVSLAASSHGSSLPTGTADEVHPLCTELGAPLPPLPSF